MLNLIADMSRKQTIESHLNQVLAMTNFNSGHRYEEFSPSIDKVAAYGIGVLIVALIGGIGSRLFRRGQ